MILGVVCARAGSKGVPHKNLKIMHGIPLIGYTLLDAVDCDLLDKIVVSTDDKEIADTCSSITRNENKIDIQMRPAELATDSASKWDVFWHIAKCNPEYDILVDLDTGCPLRAQEDITACIRKLQELRYHDVIVTAYEAERNPYFNMVCVKEEYAHILEGDWTYTRRQDAPQVYSLSPSVFAMRRRALFAYEHWSYSTLGIVEIPRTRAVDIDTQEDWDYVEFLIGKDKE